MKRRLFYYTTSFALICGAKYIYNISTPQTHDGSECKVIKEKYPEIIKLNLNENRVQPVHFEKYENQLPPRMKSVISNVQWYENNKVELKKVEEKQENVEMHQKNGKHFFVGGLQALFSCMRKLEEDPNANCVYVNDGNMLIAKRSGMQLHEHPTQYADYDMIHLGLKTLEAFSLLKGKSPDNWDFSPLHLTLPGILEIIKDPTTYIWGYGGFFLEKIRHNLFAKNEASINDQELILFIKESISYMKRVNKDIIKITGKSIINQNGRFYWSIDKKLIDKKRDNWTELNIPTEYYSTKQSNGNEITSMTLLKTDSNEFDIHALKMPNDGEIHPDIFEISIEYLTKKYPKRFEYQGYTSVDKIYYKEINDQNIIPFKLTSSSKLLKNTSIDQSIKSIYLSLGHDEVLSENKKVYDLIPVSGVTSDWCVKVKISELLDRTKLKVNSKEELKEYLKRGFLVPSADMFNLHVKILDHQWPENDENDTINFFVRVSEGAAVFSQVADKRDLINIVYKLNKFFIGDWELLTVGSCTRKTGISNRPITYKETFYFGQSGIGVSCSAGDQNKYFKK